MTRIPVGIIGVKGHVGQALLRRLPNFPKLKLAAGLVRPKDAVVGTDLGSLADLPHTGISATDNPEAFFATCDVAIDFSEGAASAKHAKMAAKLGKRMVIGTTGLTEEHRRAIAEAAHKTAILYAANTSLGVTLLAQLVRQAAAVLDSSWGIEILDLHHADKKDAPSGTALMLGRAAQEGRGDSCAPPAPGLAGQRAARDRAGGIGYASLRGGDVISEHRVYFLSQGERLEFAHNATDRAIYADGALKAAAWIAGQPPGLYGMADVLADALRGAP